METSKETEAHTLRHPHAYTQPCKTEAGHSTEVSAEESETHSCRGQNTLGTRTQRDTAGLHALGSIHRQRQMQLHTETSTPPRCSEPTLPPCLGREASVRTEMDTQVYAGTASPEDKPSAYKQVDIGM